MFDDRTHAALELADAMCGSTSVLPAELIAELRFHFSEVELAELVLVCGQANLNNRAGNAAKQLLGRVDSEEGVGSEAGVGAEAGLGSEEGLSSEEGP